MLNGAVETIYDHRILLIGLALGSLQVLLKVSLGLVHLEIARSLIQAAVYRLVELLLLHLRHLLDVRELKVEQAYKREAHYDCYNPNRSFLHNDCKDKRFLNSTYQKC